MVKYKYTLSCHHLVAQRESLVCSQTLLTRRMRLWEMSCHDVCRYKSELKLTIRFY